MKACKFKSAVNGSFVPVIGIALPVLLLATGAALETSNISRVQNHMQASMDAALIAVSLKAQTLADDMEEDERQKILDEEFRNYYSANFSQFMFGDESYTVPDSHYTLKFDKDEDVLVIAATNLKKVLDPAILRPGRFDKQIDVGLPSKKGRRLILQHYLGKVVHQGGLGDRNLSDGMVDFSGADMKNLVNIAAIHAVKNKRRAVMEEDIKFAYERMKVGIYGDSIRHEKKYNMAARHFAAHGLIAFLNKTGPALFNISLLPISNRFGGFNLVENSKDRSYQYAISKIDVLLAGRACEEL